MARYTHINIKGEWTLMPPQTRCLDSSNKSLLKSMLVDKDFLIWLDIYVLGILYSHYSYSVFHFAGTLNTWMTILKCKYHDQFCYFVCAVMVYHAIFWKDTGLQILPIYIYSMCNFLNWNQGRQSFMHMQNTMSRFQGQLITKCRLILKR